MQAKSEVSSSIHQNATISSKYLMQNCNGNKMHHKCNSLLLFFRCRRRFCEETMWSFDFVTHISDISCVYIYANLFN